MRLIVMFDLPTLTATDRRNYRKFRKKLLFDGFLMVQESVYSCILIDRQSANFLNAKIAEYTPKKGSVISLIVTEKQFAGMTFLAGGNIKTAENTFERITVI